MPRSVEMEQLAGLAHELVEAVAAGGESVVVMKDGSPVAVLAPPGLAGLTDLPRWEEWLQDMRESYPGAAGPRASRVAATEPTPVDKALLGFDPATGCFGSESGREFLAGELHRLRVPVTDQVLLGSVYSAVLELCESKQHVYDEDLRVLAQELIAEAPARLRLLALTVTSTTGLPATAEVTLELGHGPAMRREQGDGPLDAAVKAIQRLTAVEPEVVNFSVVAATRGRDAMAEAVIEVAFEGRTAIGAGASTNAIEAGVHAYLNAVNFLLESPEPT